MNRDEETATDTTIRLMRERAEAERWRASRTSDEGARVDDDGAPQASASGFAALASLTVLRPQ